MSRPYLYFSEEIFERLWTLKQRRCYFLSEDGKKCLHQKLVISRMLAKRTACFFYVFFYILVRFVDSFFFDKDM